jgi:hypothetical protein
MSLNKMVLAVESDDSAKNFTNLDEAYAAYGASVFADYAFPIMIVPVALIGLLTNSLNLIVLFRKEFRTIKLYSFLRINVFSSIILSLSEMIYPFTMSRLFPRLQNTYPGQAYGCFFHVPIQTLSFFKALIDIVIYSDRVATYYPKLKKLFKLKPYQIMILVFLIDLAIDFPYFLSFTPDRVLFFMLENNSTSANREPIEFYFSEPSSFSKSQHGRIILYMVYALKHVICLTVESTLMIISYVMLRSHLNKKNKLTANKYAIKEGERQKSSVRGGACTRGSSGNIKDKMISRTENRATLMFICISLLSVIHQSLVLLYFTYYLFSYDHVALILDCVGNFSLVVKNASNFFVFYFFNLNFRAVIKQILSCKKQ